MVCQKKQKKQDIYLNIFSAFNRRK